MTTLPRGAHPILLVFLTEFCAFLIKRVKKNKIPYVSLLTLDASLRM